MLSLQLRIALIGLFIVMQINCLLAQTTWRRSYGGFGSDRANSVRQLADGGYIVCGTTGSFGAGASDIYVLKLDEFGEPIWSRSYGEAGVDVGIACEPHDDGFLIVGYTSSGTIGGYDIVVIKVDANGNEMWQQTYGTVEWDFAEKLSIRGDDIYIAGQTFGNGCLNGCAYLLKITQEGEEIWTHSVDPARSSYGKAVVGLDDGAVMVGWIEAETNDWNGLVIKINEFGDEVWTHDFGGGDDDVFNDVLIDQFGAIVAAGVNRSLAEFEKAWLLSLSLDGDWIWERDFGAGIADAAASAFREREEGGFAVTGYNTLTGGRDMILAIFNHEGWFQFGFNYGDGELADGYGVDVTDDGGYVVAGWVEGYGPGIRSVYVVKTDSAVLTESLDVIPFTDPLKVIEFASVNPLSIHPNPITPGATLNFTIPHTTTVSSITLADLSGRTINQESCNSCSTYQIPQIASGMYRVIFNLQDGGRIAQSILVD